MSMKHPDDRNAAPRETAILLHGIGHSQWNMIFMEKALRIAGYRTLNLSYPSRKHAIGTLAGWLNEKLRAARIWEESDRVHFVGHSMGGLVTASYLSEFKSTLPAGKMGRAVMMGTPHGGSEVADFLHDFPLYKWLFGPAGQELTTKTRGSDKAVPWYDLGVIAGTRHWMYPAGMYCIPDSHDGCVSVESTRLEGMKDHITLPVLHGFMSWDAESQKQTLHFLKNGVFDHAKS